jgi:hypothetical protein
MRGIQRDVLLKPDIKDLNFINNFKTNIGDSNDE